MESSQVCSTSHDMAVDTLSLGNGSYYFGRPNRVTKPNSRNGSPRSLERRKTTTSATISSRNRSMVDQIRTSTQSQPLAPFPVNNSRSRPVSWHPNTVDAFAGSYIPGQDYSQFQFGTTQVNGLITPISYQGINEPQIHEYITPLDDYPCQSTSYSSHGQGYGDSAWLETSEHKSDFFPMYNQPSLGLPTWQFNQDPKQTTYAHTAPSSPDSAPLPGIAFDNLTLDTNDLESKDDSEELVGMGLYDSPADINGSSLLFGDMSTTQRKGLKLEESFEPEEQDDNDEDQEEEDGPGEDDDDEDNGNDKDSRQAPQQTNYSSQSIANHMPFQTEQSPTSIASAYLATLSQLNSAYYPSSHSTYGWI